MRVDSFVSFCICVKYVAGNGSLATARRLSLSGSSFSCELTHIWSSVVCCQSLGSVHDVLSE